MELRSKIKLKDVAYFQAPQKDLPRTSFTTHSTTTSPRFHHSKHPWISKSSNKMHIVPSQIFPRKNRRIKAWELAGTKLWIALQAMI
jgi:hypothetical protein